MPVCEVVQTTQSVWHRNPAPGVDEHRPRVISQQWSLCVLPLSHLILMTSAHVRDVTRPTQVSSGTRRPPGGPHAPGPSAPAARRGCLLPPSPAHLKRAFVPVTAHSCHRSPLPQRAVGATRRPHIDCERPWGHRGWQP